MSLYLIDEDGEVRKPCDTATAVALLVPAVNAATVSYAVRNLGWVSISEDERAVLISCNPAFICDTSLAALLRAVYDAPTKTIVLKTFDGNWEHQVLRDRPTFVRIISALVAGRRRSPWSQRRLLSQLADSTGHPLAARAIAASLPTSRVNDSRALRSLLDPMFNGRWHISRVDGNSGHAIAVAIGSSFTPFNPAWSSTGEGQSLCAYADEAYGLWVANHYRLVERLAVPIFDDVDAIVKFPRIGDTRLRYRRMCLPFDQPSGNRLILSAAITDSRIDLRNELGREDGQVVQ